MQHDARNLRVTIFYENHIGLTGAERLEPWYRCRSNPRLGTGVWSIFPVRCLDDGEGANVGEGAMEKALSRACPYRCLIIRTLSVVEISGRENLPDPCANTSVLTLGSISCELVLAGRIEP